MNSEFHCQACGARVTGSLTYVENVADSHVCPAPVPDRLNRVTDTGTRIYVPDAGEPARVFIDHPDQPAEFRHRLIGRINHGGFELNEHFPTNHGPEVLRALADLIEEVSR